jgi:uncharacterized phage protein gp47/JayE
MADRILPESAFSADNTHSLVLQRMLDDLPSTYDKTPGTFLYDMMSVLAAEVEGAYIQVDEAFNQAFLTNATGDYLDAKAMEMGLDRKLGGFAQTTLTFTGTVGTVVPANTRVTNIVAPGTTGTPLIFETTEPLTLVGTTGTVPAQATEVGVIYNLTAGALVRMETGITGITEVTNTEAAYGGEDPETDDEFRSRLSDRAQTGRGAGTAGDYMAWARSITGVGDAFVEPLWNGNGTVRVTVVDANRGAVSVQVLEAVTQYIRTLTPIGAQVTVITPANLSINVSATLTLDSGFALADVKATIDTNLADYLRTVVPGTKVYLTELAAVVVQAPGVLDYASFQIGAPALAGSNITLPSGTKPILGTTSFS